MISEKKMTHARQVFVKSENRELVTASEETQPTHPPPLRDHKKRPHYFLYDDDEQQDE